MALIEVDADELAKLQAELVGARPSKALLDKLGTNPKTRRKTLESIKELDPSIAIPELDAAAPVLDKVAELQARLDAAEKRNEERESERAKEARERSIGNTIEAARAKLREQGYQDEGITGVEKLMQERGLTDYEAATALFERAQPKEESILPSNYGKSWDMFAPPEDNEAIKAAVSLPKGQGQEAALRRWTNGELNKGLQELRGSRVAGRRY